ncbi:MAG: hypothetical protein AB2A00_03290 [Myxococcota bacterium]
MDTVANGGIDTDVREFIRAHINSVEQLEALLLLRAHPDQEWTAVRLNEELRTSVTSAASRLTDLAGRGFVRVRADAGPTYCYDLVGKPLDGVVARLGQAYASRRHEVINLIFAKPIENLRVFSDAFKLRRED